MEQYLDYNYGWHGDAVKFTSIIRLGARICRSFCRGNI